MAIDTPTRGTAERLARLADLRRELNEPIAKMDRAHRGRLIAAFCDAVFVSALADGEYAEAQSWATYCVALASFSAQQPGT